MEIPLVRLDDSLSGDHLLAALEPVGMVRFVAVDEAVLGAFRGLLETSRSFFTHLSSAQKECLKRVQTSGSNSGYVAYGSESLHPGSGLVDRKEAFNFQYGLEAENAIRNQVLPTDIMDAKRNFDQVVVHGWVRQLMNKVAAAMESRGWVASAAAWMTAHQIKDGNTSSLDSISNSTTLRLLHYPSEICKVNDQSVVRAGAHSDYGTFTFLFQDDVGGLQVLLDADWVDVPVQGGRNEPTSSLLLQVGDSLEIWTRQRLRSMVHRVVAVPESVPRDIHGELVDVAKVDSMKYPAKMYARERFSVALFVHPDDRFVIDPERGLTARAYVEQRLAETYAIEQQSS